MLDLVYGLPTWLTGVIVVGLATVVPGLALVIVHRRVALDRRRAANEAVGYLSNVAASVYAVILGFLAVGVWQEYGQAKSIVALEANAASDVFRVADAYPEPLRQRVREGMRRYVELVIVDEWPLLAQGRASDDAWRTLEALHREMLAFEPGGLKDQVVHAEALRHMSAMLDQRRLRIEMTVSGLHPVVWTVMLLGSAVLVAYTFFIGSPSFGAHVTMTILLGASIGLVLFLIVALDYPFRGGVAIGPQAFEDIRDSIRRAATRR